MQDIYISRLHYPVTTLGPGSRIGIWVQGCSIRCEGCISADTWRHGVSKTSVSEVIQQVRIWKGSANGVTITGGEPFDQPAALIELVQQLKQESIGDLLVYTGYAISQVQNTLDELHGMIDALISEPFEYKTADTLPIRGSDNQILHLLTENGRFLYSRYDTPTDKSALDAMFDPDGTVWFCGIPKRHDLERLKQLMQSRGHSVVFTSKYVKVDE